jgi:hypothetical protein
MTQQPNEQQDALVEKVAKALFTNEGGGEFAALNGRYQEPYIKAAQAALAAVREGHVIIPAEKWNGLIKYWAQERHGEMDDLLDELTDDCGYGEPHGRGGGGE